MLRMLRQCGHFSDNFKNVETVKTFQTMLRMSRICQVIFRSRIFQTQFRNLRMLSTFSNNLAQKLVYPDFLDIVVAVYCHFQQYYHSI